MKEPATTTRPEWGAVAARIAENAPPLSPQTRSRLRILLADQPEPTERVA